MARWLPLKALFVLTAAALVCSVFLLLLVAGAAQTSLARNALWELVHNECVPNQTQHQDPSPCSRVDFGAGIDKGYVILKDIRGVSQFLLIPTAPISGIESPEVLGPKAPNYFDLAWNARTYVYDALHKTLPRDDIGLAVNSLPSRSQDTLHIHIDCVDVDVRAALRKQEASIGNKWAPLNVLLLAHRYAAMWLPGEHLGSNNPFKLLAERVPGAAQDMGDRTLVVIGSTRSDGAIGFVILENQANRVSGDLASGEELLDHGCRVAAAAPQDSGVKPQ